MSRTGAAAGAILTGAALVSWGIGALIRAHAQRLRLVDVPNSRSSHAAPMPRGGGLGIVIATVGGLVLLALSGAAISTAQLLALGGGGTLIAAVSFVDDLRSLPAGLRLAIHLTVAAAAVALVGSIRQFGLPPDLVIRLGGASAVLTVLLIAGLTNAYNFMDGIDGLAGLQGVVTASACAVAGAMIGRPEITWTGALIAVACAGFLVHNWSPARLFMGDVGSAFLGYSLAVLITMASQADPEVALFGVLVLWPFIFDALFTLLRRAWRRENVLQAHRSHLYQRLVAGGLSHRTVALLYALLACLGAAVGMAVLRGRGVAAAIVYAIGTVTLVALLARHRGRHRAV